MFVNCPHCGGLVATDPATDQPPERCPRCAAKLRAEAAPPASPLGVDGAPADPVSAPAGGPVRDAAPVALDVEAGATRDAPAPEPPLLAAAVTPPPVLQPAPIAVTLRIDTTPAASDVPTAESAPVADVPATTVELLADTTPIASAAELLAPGHIGIAPDGDIDVATAGAITMQAASTAPAPAAARAPAGTAPTFARHRVASPARAGTGLWLAAAALLVLLGVQWLLADRARLAQDARWRPLVLRTCALLRCDVPAWREPTAFTVVDRDVRPHPTRAGVLRVSATFRNDARWAQAWPRLQLTLSDVDGRAEGIRAFTVAEYLAAAPTQDGLASGQLASVRMDIVEPSPRVVSFAFDFR